METRLMKKVLPALLFALIVPARIFCAQYRISGVSYDITGMTMAAAVSRAVPVDTNAIFPNEDAFAAYIADYTRRLENTRLFDEVKVEYTTRLFDAEADLYLADLHVTLNDNFHLLAAPYPKYNSNTGFEFKLKVRDTNFFGTMQTMTTDLNLNLEEAGGDANMKKIVGDMGMRVGFNFDFNFPFRLGAVNATWINSHALSYTIGYSSPQWNLSTGLGFSIPLGARSSLYLQFTQGFTRSLNAAYINTGDDLYFSENGYLSLPIRLYRIENWADVYYTPYVSATYAWDFDGIDKQNSGLKGPAFSIGHTVSTGRVNWVGNFRDGLSLSTTQYFSYNTGNKALSSKFNAEAKFFKAFEKLNFVGASGDAYFFICVNEAENFGARLRGIRDGQCVSESALVINMDLPIRLFATNFQSNRILRALNFELQVSPFFDAALFKNTGTKRSFAVEDGFYAGGLEVIVHPERWRSIQIRGSVGFDLGRILLSRWIDTSWRPDVSPYEISVGIGLHY